MGLKPPVESLTIRIMGDPILRQRARPLAAEEITRKATQELIEAMRETMHRAPGVGLAAPQIGLPLQLAVIEDRESSMRELSARQRKERERKPVSFHVIINPVLTLESPLDVEFFEGCLSLPGYLALVPRARKVKVECLDHRCRPRTIHASGWYARILQHEIDHLAGAVYLDRMRSTTFTSLENYKRFTADKTSNHTPETPRA